MPHRSAVLLAGLLAGTCVACGTSTDVGAPEDVTFTAAEDVPVLVPGRPGEDPERVEPGQTGQVADATAYNDADVAFVMGMVPHHAQALVMAELAPGRASDERVMLLAERIIASQSLEIAAMEDWLASQGLPAASADHDMSEMSDMEGMDDMGGMVGMATPAQLEQLAAAEGEDFDRLFLELMTVHHQGALVMSEQALTAMNPIISALVDDVVSTQNAEIARMDEILADLG